MTQKQIEGAFAGESQAYMKYTAFANKAEAEGKPNAARLFRAIAFAEQCHAMKYADVLGLVEGTAANLQAGKDGEDFEVLELYPAALAVAQLQREEAAARAIDAAADAEQWHSTLYAAAKKGVEEQGDAQVGDIYVCTDCGHTGEGQAPEKCPYCDEKREWRTF
jgi:rubrerythrin